MNNNGEKKLKEGDLGPAAGRRISTSTSYQKIAEIVRLIVIIITHLKYIKR
jgi:hypothetical protein